MGCCPVWCAGCSNLSVSSCSLYFELWCLSQVGELYSWGEHQDIRRGSNRQCLHGFCGGMLRLMTHYLFSFSTQRLISFTRHLCGKLGNSKKLNAHMDRTLGNLSGLSKFLFFTLVPAMVCPSPRSSLQQGLTLTPEGWGGPSSTGGCRKTSFLIDFMHSTSGVLSHSGVQMQIWNCLFLVSSQKSDWRQTSLATV